MIFNAEVLVYTCFLFVMQCKTMHCSHFHMFLWNCAALYGFRHLADRPKTLLIIDS